MKKKFLTEFFQFKKLNKSSLDCPKKFLKLVSKTELTYKQHEKKIYADSILWSIVGKNSIKNSFIQFHGKKYIYLLPGHFDKNNHFLFHSRYAVPKLTSFIQF